MEPEKSIQMSRQENEELIRTLEASNKNITKKLKDFSRRQKLREKTKGHPVVEESDEEDEEDAEEPADKKVVASPSSHDRGLMPLKRVRKTPPPKLQ